MLDRFCVQKSSSRNNNKNELDKPYKMEPVYEDLSLLHVDKSVGRRLSDLTDLKAILAIFIGEPPNSSSRPHSASIQLASQIKSQLQLLLGLAEKNSFFELFQFFSSSLLIVYENHQLTNHFFNVRLRMIDFAHSYPILFPETNCPSKRQRGRSCNGYAVGLRNLLTIFERLAEP